MLIINSHNENVFINKVEQAILDCLEIGENVITIATIGEKINLNSNTAQKYITRLCEKKLLIKVIKGQKGGTKGDRTRVTLITKLLTKDIPNMEYTSQDNGEF